VQSNVGRKQISFNQPEIQKESKILNCLVINGGSPELIPTPAIKSHRVCNKFGRKPLNRQQLGTNNSSATGLRVHFLAKPVTKPLVEVDVQL